MKTERSIWLVGLVVVGVAGFAISQEKARPERTASKQSAPAAPAKTNSVKQAESTVVGYLEQRDRTIVIKTGAQGIVYTVKSADGKVLFDNLSLEQLEAQAPELHDFLKTATGRTGKQKADARLRPRLDARF